MAKALQSQLEIDQQALTQINHKIELQAPKRDFDTEVLAPLRAKQEEERVAAEAARQAAIAADYQATADRMKPFGTYGSNYAPGNCTLYVASRIPVPNSMGNATNWSYGLLAAGWRTGGPRRGAVGVSHAGWAGHVVVVESDNGDGTVTISEMNWLGLGRVDTRVASASDFEYYF